MGSPLAYRLALLCTSKSGYLQGGPKLLDRAARTALLTELILMNKIDLNATVSTFDVAPTGEPAADAVLEWLSENPAATMLATIQDAPVTMSAVIAAEQPTRAGGWARWTDRLDLSQVIQQRSLVFDVIADGSTDDPATAALICLAEALSVVAVTPDGAFLRDCGAAVDFVRDASQYLTSLADQLSLVSTLPHAG